MARFDRKEWHYQTEIHITISLLACSKGNKEENGEKGEFPANISFPAVDLSSSEPIPILAWYSVFGENTTLKNYQDIKEAGFTHNLSFPRGEKDISSSFDYAQKVGLKMLLYVDRTWTTEEEVRDRVTRYKNHPVLFGYYVFDEPSQDKFPEVSAAVKFVQGIDSEHPCYVNLFPNIQNPTYREYVNNFIQTVPVSFLSFDHYPILGENDTSPVRYLRPEWYENLEIIAAASRKAGKDFWAFALSTAHTVKIGNDPISVYPIPTLADLRLQVYSNLAYGAQGIQYFTYFTPSGEGETFHDGPFYQGRKTPTYDTVKEMNKEIKALSGVFLNSKVLWVAHTGEEIPKGTKRFNLKEAPSMTPFSTVKTKGEGAVISFLEKGSLRFMVVVNRNLKVSMPLLVKLHKNAVVRQVDKTGEINAENMPQSYITQIEPGDMAVFAYPNIESIQKSISAEFSPE